MSMRERVKAIDEAAQYFDEQVPYIDDGVCENWNEVVAAIDVALAEAERMDADYHRAREAHIRCANHEGTEDDYDLIDAYFGREVPHD